MKRLIKRLLVLILAVAAALAMRPMLFAQARLTLDYSAMAKRLVAQLALKPGEKVLSIAQAGVMADLLPHLRYEVMRAGGVDLGVVEILRRSSSGARASRGLTTRRCSAMWMRRS